MITCVNHKDGVLCGLTSLKRMPHSKASSQGEALQGLPVLLVWVYVINEGLRGNQLCCCQDHWKDGEALFPRIRNDPKVNLYH